METIRCCECGKAIQLEDLALCGGCMRRMHARCIGQFHSERRCRQPTSTPDTTEEKGKR